MHRRQGNITQNTVYDFPLMEYRQYIAGTRNKYPSSTARRQKIKSKNKYNNCIQHRIENQSRQRESKMFYLVIPYSVF